MCGIAGYFQPITGVCDPREVVNKMSAAIEHRGPDAHGLWVEDNGHIAIGHRRLSIMDLSPAGSQPMVSVSGRYILSFNGEIYNHISLRKTLDRAKTSREWLGSSDTETLLRAIEFWGLRETLNEISGMFAIALWDRKLRTLSLARDRFGEKPLYFWQGQEEFAFASDLVAIEALPNFVRNVSRASAIHYFRRGWQRSGATIWENVYKVEPGEVVEVSSTLELRRDRYWNTSNEVKLQLSQPFHGDLSAATLELEDVLRAAVSRQMLSDAPIGAWLSGGIDSSLVVSLMQQQSSRAVETFSIGFEEKAFDESSHARDVAGFLGTKHRELVCSASDVLSIVPDIPHIFSEPFADVSQLPSILLSRMTSGQVKVALTGDGADELFGGYNRHVMAGRIYKMKSRAGLFGSVAGRLAAKMPAGLLKGLGYTLGYNTTQFDMKYRKLLHFLLSDDEQSLYAGMLDRLPPNSHPLVGSLDEQESALALPRNTLELDSIHQLMLLDTLVYMPEDVLVKVDRAAMAAGLETRAPFLDPEVFRFAWRLPSHYKVDGATNKVVLRRLMTKLLPPKLAHRPKQGFSVPISLWLSGPLKEWASDLINPHSLTATGLFNETAVSSIMTAFNEGDPRYAETIWDIVVFMAWSESRNLGVGS